MNLRHKSRRKHIVVTSILALIGLATLSILGKGLFLNPAIVTSTQLGQQAKDFEIDILEGQAWLPKSSNGKVRLSDLRGRKVVLNFWASWCPTCKEEAIEIEKYWQRYRDTGIIVLGIAFQDTPEAAREFAKLHGKTYPLGIDTTGKTILDYGVYGAPESFIINENGIILHKEAGPVTARLLEDLNLKFQANQSDRG